MIIMAVIIGIIVLAASALIVIYNTFIRRKNLAAEAWSGIDVQLKRRYDLIPEAEAGKQFVTNSINPLLFINSS